MVEFSTIIPAYNAANFIGSVLNSIKNQNYLPMEIIIIDDGSTDNTANVVDRFFTENKGFNGRLLRQENKKIAAARNAGINVANGEWIAFLDADDIWYESKLERVADIIMSDPHVDLVCHDERISVNREIVKENKYGPFINYLDILFDSCCLSTSAVCVRKEKLLEVGGFSENLDFNGAEDYDLWLRLSKRTKFHYLHEFLGEYRISENNCTSNIDIHTSNYLNVVDRHFKDLSKNEQVKYKKKYNVRVSGILAGAGRSHIKNKDFGKARYWYLKSFKYRKFDLKAILGYILSLMRIKF